MDIDMCDDLFILSQATGTLYPLFIAVLHIYFSYDGYASVCRIQILLFCCSMSTINAVSANEEK